ncbi:hypothetical protein CCYA_CCYA01G0273 [Cyanidiococcus yangmingshanensis]|nr:hypothetical protein CCYA_CCYA01G0273 [Cyanidiococcus yangmingshanensis]
MALNESTSLEGPFFVGAGEGSVGLSLTRRWPRRPARQRPRRGYGLRATAAQPRWSLVQWARRVLFPPQWVALAREHVFQKLRFSRSPAALRGRDWVAATAVGTVEATSTARTRRSDRTGLLGTLVCEWVEHDRRLAHCEYVAPQESVEDPMCALVWTTERLRSKWRRLRTPAAVSALVEPDDTRDSLTVLNDQLAATAASKEAPLQSSGQSQRPEREGTAAAATEFCAGPALARCWSAPELGIVDDEPDRLDPERTVLDYLGNIPILLTTNTPQGRLLQRKLRVARLQARRWLRESLHGFMQSAPARLVQETRRHLVLHLSDRRGVLSPGRFQSTDTTEGSRTFSAGRRHPRLENGSAIPDKGDSSASMWRSVSHAALTTLQTLSREWPFYR